MSSAEASGPLKMTFEAFLPPKNQFQNRKKPDALAETKSIEQIADALKKNIGSDSVLEIQKENPGDPYIVLDAPRIHEAVKFLRDDKDHRFTYLLVVSTIDYLGQEEDHPILRKEACIEVVYVLYSFISRSQVMLKVRLDREQPSVASLSDLYRAANWYERECYDVMGVNFTGHPHLKRILLPEDWRGHPLRKDYVFPENYNGMKVPL